MLVFYGKFADKENNPNIYNVDGHQRCWPVYKPWQPEVMKVSFFCQSGSVIVFSIPKNIFCCFQQNKTFKF
jgi:hypothetical protein